MTEIERALWEKWIARFGRKKIKELTDGLKAGRSIGEKSAAVVKSNSVDELRGMLLEGFDGYFHQTVYLLRPARPKISAATLKEIEVGETANSVNVESSVDLPGGYARCLLMASRRMEFLSRASDSVVTEDIPFPVSVRIDDGMMCVQVLTMQSGVETWSEILEQDLKRMLSTIQADSIHDQVLNFLREFDIDVGEYVDYSSAAAELLEEESVDTFSGKLGVGTVGSTKHDTIRGKKKRALRESMPKKFQELVHAHSIIQAEIQLSEEHLGLSAGSKVALYPSVGKMAFRSNLQGCDPDEFVKAMGKL